MGSRRSAADHCRGVQPALRYAPKFKSCAGFAVKGGRDQNLMANDSEEISVVKEPAEIDTYSGQYQRAGERRPALVFLRGELLAVQIPLERAEVTLGRALDADIRINDSRASRLHARVVTEPDAATGVVRYRLKDLNSTNGTILNGKAIDQAMLQDGDKFEIGDQLIRFEMLDEIDREFQQQIHRLLVHDELTGLLTSKSFFSELRREAARAEAESMPFCVLMLDIDYFKEVNDTYGHLVGSETLEEVGEVIKRTLRAGDVGARFGGEEFAAFLLDAEYQQGLVAAERVRSAIEAHDFPQCAAGVRTRHARITSRSALGSLPFLTMGAIRFSWWSWPTRRSTGLNAVAAIGSAPTGPTRLTCCVCRRDSSLDLAESRDAVSRY